MTAKLIVSPKWHMLAEDWRAIAKKALYDLAPFAVVVIPVIIEKVPAEWAYAATALWALGRLKDYFIYLTKQTVYRP